MKEKLTPQELAERRNRRNALRRRMSRSTDYETRTEGKKLHVNGRTPPRIKVDGEEYADKMLKWLDKAER